jgi:hypothetical protein
MHKLLGGRPGALFFLNLPARQRALRHARACEAALHWPLISAGVSGETTTANQGGAAGRGTLAGAP